MAQPQLKLVIDAPAIGATPQDATRRIFEHWLLMLGKSPRRCKLGTTRRAAINAALTVYDEDTLLLTMEGIAADPLEGKPESMRAAMRELEWLLASEARIDTCSSTISEGLITTTPSARTSPASMASRALARLSNRPRSIIKTSTRLRVMDGV